MLPVQLPTCTNKLATPGDAVPWYRCDKKPRICHVSGFVRRETWHLKVQHCIVITYYSWKTFFFYTSYMTRSIYGLPLLFPQFCGEHCTCTLTLILLNFWVRMKNRPIPWCTQVCYVPNFFSDQLTTLKD